MESVQGQKPIDHNTTQSSSKQDLTPASSGFKDRKHSLSWSSSSLSSIEDESKAKILDQDPDSDRDHSCSPNTRSATEQWPPTQAMEDLNKNTYNPKPQAYKLPSRVFARTISTAPVEWSTMSNESLFSIHMGNMSFTGDYFKSGELAFPPPAHSPHFDNTQYGSDFAVKHSNAPQTIQVDAIKANDDVDKVFGGVRKPDEEKAAQSIREVIKANEDANGNAQKIERSLSRRSDDFSVKSFAFPILGNVDNSGSLHTDTPRKQRKPSQPETPKIVVEPQEDQGFKEKQIHQSQTPKSQPGQSSNGNNKWLSCFPCCATFCV